MVRGDADEAGMGHLREALADPEMAVEVLPEVVMDREVATEAMPLLLVGTVEEGEGMAHRRLEPWACEDLLNQDLHHLRMPTTLTTTLDRHRLAPEVDRHQSWIARRMGTEVLICQ